MKAKVRLFSILLICFGAAASVWAASQKLGAEVSVSTCVVCKKRLAAVAGAASGAFVVVWESTSTADPKGVSARFYTVNGAPRGADAPVSRNAGLDQYDASVAVNAQGIYAVAWSEVGDDNNSEIFVQRFRSTGQALGAAIRVNVDEPTAPLSPLDFEPAIAASRDGGFVVAWVRFIPPGATTEGTRPEVMVRRFNSNGAPLGAPAKLSTGLLLGTRPDICVDTANRAVVVWTIVDAIRPFEPSKKGVVMRRVAPAGTPLGAELRVAPPTADDSQAAVSCGNGGTFVVVWSSDQAPASSAMDILAQRFTTAGRRQGAVFRVNSRVDGDQREPAISHDGRGAFVVVWQSRAVEETVVGRRFTAAGTADGADFVVRTRGEDEDRPTEPDVAHIGTAGNFVVVWQHSNAVVRAQRFRVTAGRR
ncbi:MAG TPA: hypothetical protein VF756_07125 [Thermoanaerobaculia bacterium]